MEVTWDNGDPVYGSYIDVEPPKSTGFSAVVECVDPLIVSVFGVLILFIAILIGVILRRNNDEYSDYDYWDSDEDEEG